MNPKFPDREVPLGKRSRPGPVFARSNETSSSSSAQRERERERERKREKKKKKNERRKKKRTIGTPRRLLSERITKDADDDDVDFDDEVLLRSPVGRRHRS